MSASPTAVGPLPRPRARQLYDDDAGRSPSLAATPGAGRALVLSGSCAAAVGGVLLLDGSAIAHPVLGIGLLLAAGGALVLRRGAAERTVAALVVVLLAPLLLAIALAVRLNGSGPALVRGVGATGDTTSALRFRTTGPDAGRTPVGRLLHRLCLDELPTLLDGARGRLPMFRHR